MELQTLIVVALVALALLFVGRRAWATLRPKRDAGCAHDCGCGPAQSGPSDWSKT
ncbi:MAG: FeoB-associated Cys-rich membrane protein [Gemmatirosa sp.]